MLNNILEYSSVVQYFAGYNKTQLSYHTYLSLGLEKKGYFKKKKRDFHLSLSFLLLLFRS